MNNEPKTHQYSNFWLIFSGCLFFLIIQIGEAIWFGYRNSIGMNLLIELGEISIIYTSLHWSKKINNTPSQRHYSFWKSCLNALWIYPLEYLFLIIGQSTLTFIFGHLPTNPTVSNNQSLIDSLSHSNNSLFLILFVIFGCLVAPISEEFIFRTLLIGPREYTPNKWLYCIRIILSIIIFASLHMTSQFNQLLHGNELAWFQFIIYLALSSSLTILYVWKRSYKINTIAHIILNIISFSTLF